MFRHAAILALLVGACTAPQVAPSIVAQANRCSPASPALLSAISQGLTVQGGGTLQAGYTVKSADYEKVWMVAAEINGAGMDGVGDVGLWATNDLNGAGMIFAVDGMANEFSDWADGRATDAQLSISDDGASEAKECTSGG
jgi:hypothetical protein